MATIEIRPLRRADERSGFSCGDPALDRYFQHYAGQNQFKLNLAVTYVALVAELIAGFATVSVGSIERDTVPSARLRKRLPGYPLPVIRLARLGVSTQVQGHGIGRRLLRFVLRLALDQRQATGCVGVVTDAKPGAVRFYEQLGFIPLAGVQQGALHGEPTPMFLSIRAVEAACEGAPE